MWFSEVTYCAHSTVWAREWENCHMAFRNDWYNWSKSSFIIWSLHLIPVVSWKVQEMGSLYNACKQPKIINVHCICYVVDLCVKAAVKALPLKVDDLLVETYYHFHHSFNRPSEYSEYYTTEYKSVVKRCQTRWLSLGHAIRCTLQMWEPLCSYFCSHSDNEKAGKVRMISTVLKDPPTKLWLLFLSNILPVFVFSFSHHQLYPQSSWWKWATSGQSCLTLFIQISL